MMDYGDRQERAVFIVKRFRSDSMRNRFALDRNDRKYTYGEIADEIENMTDVGRTTVAVAGFVFAAMNATPDFFSEIKSPV